jgi:hypothetical protein
MSPRISPRGRSFDYFEEALTAERYAKLIGRPHALTDKRQGIRRMNLAFELERREKDFVMDFGKDPSSTVSTTASGCSTPSLARSRQVSVRKYDVHAIASKLQDLESGESEAWLADRYAEVRFELQDLKVSLLHKRAVVEGASEDELASVMDSDSQRDSYIDLIMAKMQEKAQKPPMPLALRRVVASVMPNAEYIPQEMAHDLRTAFRASAQTIQRSQRMRNRVQDAC